MPVAAAPLFWAAVAGAAGTAYAAHEQSSAADTAARLSTDAANRAGAAQARSAAEALAFTRQQAQSAYQQSEADRRANYDQDAARQRRLDTVGQLLGFGPREIPAYVPSPPPNFDVSLPKPTWEGDKVTGGPTYAQPSVSGPGASESSGDQALGDLLRSGMAPQDAVREFNQRYGRTTGNEAVYYPNNNTIGLPSGYYSTGANGWQFAPRSGSSASSAAPPRSVGASLIGMGAEPYAPQPTRANPWAMAIPAVAGSIGSSLATWAQTRPPASPSPWYYQGPSSAYADPYFVGPVNPYGGA